MLRQQCHWGVMWGSVETGLGPWSSRTTCACSRVGRLLQAAAEWPGGDTSASGGSAASLLEGPGH